MKQKLQRGDIIEGIVSCEDFFCDTPYWRLIFLQHPEKFGVLPRQEKLFPGQTVRVKIKNVAGNRVNCLLSRKGGAIGKTRSAS